MVNMDSNGLMQLLRTIPDPEIPVINIVELGMVRKASMNGAVAQIELTPTYTGCPAMKLVENQIRETILSNGISAVEIETVFAPAWNTDQLSEETRSKLNAYGIAPPPHSSQENHTVHCPRCTSDQTELISRFGSTACKALYRCKNCKEPFEQFKCLA
jgi:ring-1,2-phenylacetyl-CoA epoxidase subunit PaaD